MSIFKSIKNRFKKVYNKLKNAVNQGILKPIKKKFNIQTIKEIPQKHKDELEIASEVYKSPNDRAKEIMGYKYDRDISKKRSAVYVNEDNKEVTLALRGTVPSNIRDLGSDVKILLDDTLNKTTNQFKNSQYMKDARKALKRVKSKYPNYEITIVGHSLGGRGSIQLSKEHKNIDSVTFNSGGGNFTKNQIPKTDTHYRAPTDPISVGFALDSQTKNVKPDDMKVGLNHSIKYFK